MAEKKKKRKGINRKRKIIKVMGSYTCKKEKK
jgi:hypothetical protein